MTVVTDGTGGNSDETTSMRIWWQNWGISVLAFGISPLLPLLIQHFGQHKVTEDALLITLALYCLTIALITTSRFYFFLEMILAVFLSAIYGLTTIPGSAHEAIMTVVGIHISSYSTSMTLDDNRFLFVVMLLLFVSVVVERFFRHVINHEEVFEFLKTKTKMKTA